MAEEEKPPPRSIGQDPFASFRFKVIISGSKSGSDGVGCNEVTGLEFETETQNFREGGVNTAERQLVGPAKSPAKLILKRGLTNSDELWSWYLRVMEGRIERKQVTIELQDYAGAKGWRWVFRQACPVKWSGPQFRAGTAEVAFESIELIHNGLQPGTPSGPQQ